MKRSSSSLLLIIVCSFGRFNAGVLAQQPTPQPIITDSTLAPLNISIPFPTASNSSTQKVYDIPRADGGVTSVTHNWSSPSHAPGTYLGPPNYSQFSSEATSARKFVGGNSEAEVWANLVVVGVGITAEVYKQNEPEIKAGMASFGKKVDAATDAVKKAYDDTAAAADRATKSIKANWQAVSNSEAAKTTSEVAKTMGDGISKASAEVSKALTQDTVVKQKAVEYWEKLFGK